MDSAVCNNVIVGLFGDLLNPSEFHVWDAKTGKELSVLFSGFDENCFCVPFFDCNFLFFNRARSTSIPDFEIFRIDCDVGAQGWSVD